MKKLVVLLGIALVAVGAAAIHMWRQVEFDRQQIADLQASLQQAQSARQDAEAALARQARAMADRLAATPSPAAVPAPAAAPQPAVSATVSALTEEMRNQQNDPRARDIRRAQSRMFLPTLNPNLGKWLNLTSDQEAKLFDLMAKQESEQSALILDPANRNDPAAQQEAMKKAQAQRQANDADLAALLGDKYPKFQEYQQTRSVHSQVSRLQAMVGTGADGLSDAQYRSLTSALVAEQLRFNQERPPLASSSRSAAEMLQQSQQRSSEANRRMLQVAATQLNAQQLDSFRALVEQQERTSSALSRSLREAEAAAAAARPASGQ